MSHTVLRRLARKITPANYLATLAQLSMLVMLAAVAIVAAGTTISRYVLGEDMNLLPISQTTFLILVTGWAAQALTVTYATIAGRNSNTTGTNRSRHVATLTSFLRLPRGTIGVTLGIVASSFASIFVTGTISTAPDASGTDAKVGAAVAIQFVEQASSLLQSAVSVAGFLAFLTTTGAIIRLLRDRQTGRIDSLNRLLSNHTLTPDNPGWVTHFAWWGYPAIGLIVNVFFLIALVAAINSGLSTIADIATTHIHQTSG